MPSDRYRRSRSRSRGRYSDRKRRSRSRSLRRDRRSRSPRRHHSRSPQPTRRRSRSPEKERRRSRTPLKDRRRSRSPRTDRRRSSPQKGRQVSRSPQAPRSTDSAYRRKSSSPSAPKSSSGSLLPSKDKRTSRYSKSPSCSPEDKRADVRGGRVSSDSVPSHSPTTLDDVLMREKPLSKTKPSLSTRYEKFDINVICMHSKGKGRRSSQDIDDDGSANDFFPSDVIELVHQLNPKPSSRKRQKTIFDREEIKNFVEEEVETKVIRLAPSADEIKKLEAKLSKSDASRSRDNKYRDDRGRRDRSSRDSRDNLKREPERSRYQVTDDDLLDGPSTTTSRLASEKDSKRSIQDRLGSSVTTDRDDRSSRRIDDRLGRMPDRPSRDADRVSSSDLRHNLSSRGRDVESRQAPIVRDYGHKSLSTRFNRTSREREPTPDFSKRPDKGKVDMMEIDPTYVPRGGMYDEHDDRTENRGDWRDRGDWRSRGDWRGRGVWRARGRGYGGRGGFSRNYNSFGNDNMRDRRPGGPRVIDQRSSRPRKPVVAEAWKHDKFDELEEDVKAEPTSTTA